jgi:PhnB protein
LVEILDAWLSGEASSEQEDRANVAHLDEIGAATRSGAVAQLSVRGGRAAVDFYRDAFGAVEVYRVGGSDEHEAVVSQLIVGGTSIWVADESPKHLNFSPASLGGGTVRRLLVVADPDATVARALAAGGFSTESIDIMKISIGQLAPARKHVGWTTSAATGARCVY